MPDISPYLTKAGSTGTGVRLMVGDAYAWGLLGGGVLLVVAAIVLIIVMTKRVKFFALEFGKGRFSILFPYLLLSTLMFIVGSAATWLGWQAQEYSLTLDSTGLTERQQGGTTHYTWAEAESASERVKSTEFWIVFAHGTTETRRVVFQQKYIGEKMQDRAIELTEEGLIGGTARRVP